MLCSAVSFNLLVPFPNGYRSIKTNVLAGRLKPDWEKALPKLERAVTGFKLAKRHESAREVYEKIAQAQERLGSDWHAGQAYENAARMSKLAGNDQDMFECVLHAAEYYNKAGRMNYAAEAYARGAKVNLVRERKERIRSFCSMYFAMFS